MENVILETYKVKNTTNVQMFFLMYLDTFLRLMSKLF